MLWIGERSYGIYLWHWVVFQVTRPSVDLAGAAWAINSARILIVIALADISLRWVEIPIRRGKLSDWLRGMKYRRTGVRIRQKIVIAGSTILVLLGASGASIAAIIENDDANTVITAVTGEATTSSTTVSSSKSGLWVTGDSVILGIRSKLASHYPIALVNARVGRQIGELINVVQADRVGLEKSTVIFDLGNNNHLTEADVRTLFKLFQNQPRIIVVDTAVPRPWREDNNRIIKKVITDYPQATLVDWESISLNHPEYFAPDGVHLDEAGGDVYVNAILEALNK